MIKKIIVSLAVIVGSAFYSSSAEAQEYEEGPLEFSINGEECSVHASDDYYNPHISGEIVIPDYYMGYPVTEISSGGFTGRTGITSITIGDNVKYIGPYAFAGCSNLKILKLPYSLEGIGEKAFMSYSGPNGYLDGPMFDEVYINNLAGWCKMVLTVENNPVSKANSLFVNGAEATKLIIPDGVEEIADCVFSFCPTVEEIVFPESLLKIGDGSFSHCSSLKSIHIPKSLVSIGTSAFLNCHNLGGNIDLSGDVVSIGHLSFAGCENITGVNLGKNIRKIGGLAFQDCNSIENVWIPDLETWMNIDYFEPDCYYSQGNNPLEYAKHFWIGGNEVTSIDIPAGVTETNPLIFKGGKMITSISLPESLNKIGAHCFSGCGFPSIELPSGLTYIDEAAFSGCMLKTIKIPSGISSIQRSTFASASLESIELPDGLVSIGDYAFQYCNNLNKIEIPVGLNSIGFAAFRGCTNLDKIELPSNLATLGGCAFELCTSLETIKIPSSITVLEENTFANCYNLESVVLPSQLKEMKRGVFWATSKLGRVNLPASLEKIGRECLYRLIELHCDAITPPVVFSDFVENSKWDNFSKATLYVPNQSVSAYKSHITWGKFKNIYGETSDVESVSGDSKAFEVGADGVNINAEANAEIYNLSGVKICSGKSGFYSLPHGYYILKIDGSAHKIRIN